MSWRKIIPRKNEPWWDVLLRAGVIYKCPKDTDGKRLGPLVPYAGKDANGQSLVGDDYVNFGMLEEHIHLVQILAQSIAKLMGEFDPWKGIWDEATTIVGIPEGGRTLGQMLALALGKRFVFPVKVPWAALQAVTGKAEYGLAFDRSTLGTEDRVIVCNDVHHNMQNTHTVLEIIGRTGAKVIGLCSAVNRSPTIEDF